MRKVVKPVDSVADVFENCISKVKKPALKARLKACIPELVSAATDLDQKIATNDVHTIMGVKTFKSGLTASQMIKVYTDRMAKKKAPGRYMYNKIVASAPKGICPLCGHRQASTIDHYVDKSHCSQFIVTPVNLVPACRDCNTNKARFPFPTSSEMETIHPYFDNIESEQWLDADIVQTAGVPIVFAVRPPASWLQLKIDRTTRHFNVFQLGHLYSMNASDELGNIRYTVVNLYQTVGPTALQLHLEGEAISRRKNHVNSWQTAMYRALSNSTWFCNGGVLQL